MVRNRRSDRRRSRPGLSLVEMAVAIAVVSVLLVAIGSVVVVAAKALPTARGPGEANLSAGAALDSISAELRMARTITESTATSVAFTVADRDNDGHDETIRYAWAGVAGNPVTREYNGAAPVPVVAAANSFALSYTKLKHTATTQSTVTQDSGEVLLSSFGSWAGIIATANNLNVTTASWAAEAFTIDKVTIPSDITRLAITRVSLKLKKPSSGTVGATVGIYLPSSAGATTPAATPLGTPFSIPAASLSTTVAWVDSTFTDVVLNNASNQNFVIVVKGVASTTSATLQYLNALLAPLDNSMFRYTTNSGSSWQPSSSLNANDAPYSVYGSYQRQVQSTVSVDTYTLTSVGMSLQPTSSTQSRIDTSVETVNTPGIVGP